MLLHHFQIILNFLYVCQSVRWRTSLLKLDIYKDISCSGWDFFLKLFGDIPQMFIHYFQIIMNFLFVYQSVSLLTSLLILDKYRDISGSWLEIFLILKKHSWDFVTLVQIFFWISCKSISLFVGLVPYWKGQVLVIQGTIGGCRRSSWPSGLPLFSSSYKPYN